MSKKTEESPSRRRFLTASAAAAATLPITKAAHIAGDDLLRVGLIGCGGRGTGAARQALRADRNVKLVAMADVFSDRLQRSLGRLQGDREIAGKVDVPEARRFIGFDAYQQVIACTDVVLLCTPPHFRPMHLRAAVNAGKHVFAEKPVAVDAPGVRSVLESCRIAARRRLSVVSGLCLRYSNGFRQMMQRLHDRAIGDIVALQANDFRGGIWMFPRQRDWTDMEWQMRNWYYFTWLSGDFNVEQHVHMLDVCAWAMQDRYPVRAMGTGGRIVRRGPEYGNIYDHFAVNYEYDNGVKLFSHCRQIPRCRNNIGVYVIGSRGKATVTERRMELDGPQPWRTNMRRDNNFYQTEHDELFASIRQGRPINNGEYMAKSTLLAIMGRMAAYTGQEITWEMAMNSREDLSPSRYEWGPIPTPVVARPGTTRFR